jgi:hypothetical protein
MFGWPAPGLRSPQPPQATTLSFQAARAAVFIVSDTKTKVAVHAEHLRESLAEPLFESPEKRLLDCRVVRLGDAVTLMPLFILEGAPMTPVQIEGCRVKISDYILRKSGAGRRAGQRGLEIPADELRLAGCSGFR